MEESSLISVLNIILEESLKINPKTEITHRNGCSLFRRNLIVQIKEKKV